MKLVADFASVAVALIWAYGALQIINGLAWAISQGF